ncbi:MAG: 4Fe-4S dicluster domain-containing protein [Alphaproteobacteria bacterium]|nr:4Fe-4S dicluster domain-containing protein [Alphaproteobacteria bacterium]
MELNGRRILLCNCEQTMTLDGKALAKACGAAGTAEIASQLCRAQIDNFRGEIAKGGRVIVACTQEAPLFHEVAGEIKDGAALGAVNIRETAGWSQDSAAAMPKIAALLAEAAVEIPPTPTVTMESGGVCLVYGTDEAAVAAARQLGGRLDVTLLLSRPGEVMPPRAMDVPVFRGTIASAKGHLGAFEIAVDDYAPASVSARSWLEFEAPRDGAVSKCDLILDLSGGAPLFPAGERVDGYFRPDPGNPALVQKALFDISDMVGEFEKPRYVKFTPDLCTHSRSMKTGCTRCLDVCPVSAIVPDGDHVAIDPFLCGGCGGCNSVCPTGAARYDMPPAEALFARLRAMLSTYHGAGGTDAILLLHDNRHGADLIHAMARHGRGLPANVLPFAVHEATMVSFDLLACALGWGAAAVRILVGAERKGELSGLAQQIGLAEAMMSGLGYGSGRVSVIDEADPDAVERVLWDDKAPAAPKAGSFLPMGGKRAVTGLALAHLYEVAPAPVDMVPLPDGAPFGRVVVREAGCTLCLACVGACPTGALKDNPDKPHLGFEELACVQCGLCRSTCPESVITLEPRLAFTPEARGAVTLKEEEPFACVRCGKPFGTKSSIERVVAQLAGKHPMFADGRMAERIKMCDDCRVIDQLEAGDDPFRGPDRPKPRTTDDDLREREEEIEAARAKLLEERAKEESGEG